MSDIEQKNSNENAENKKKPAPRSHSGRKSKPQTNQDQFVPRLIQDTNETAGLKTQSLKNRSKQSQQKHVAQPRAAAKSETTGTSGAQDVAGASGTRGTRGATGTSGAQGTRGTSGARGTTGASGTSGTPHRQGGQRPRTGQSGAQGGRRQGQQGTYQKKNQSQTPTWARDTELRGHTPPEAKISANAPVLSPQYSLIKSRGGSHRGTNIRDNTQQMVENTSRLAKDTLKVIPLGGLCEIGKNMTVYQYGDDMIIVDVGVLFPEENQPGIDAVIPDYSYVLEHLENLRAIFITHGHEDHIGSLPYLMKSIRKNVPIYAGKLAAELIKAKFEDRGMKQFSQQVYSVLPGQTRSAGVFEVEFINVNHSIADAFMLAIHTPVGVAVHSGDFKVDYTPVNGKPIDLLRLAELGREGVLLYLGESTNVERPGFTMSERTVGETFSQEFKKAKGRLFVATFSSNTSRVQQIITAAEENNRKVALVGRSMLNVFNAASKLGYMRIKEGTLVELNEISRLKPEEVCIISTGSQGEPMSALTRMAYAEHHSIEIHDGDTVIISATPIPGNEKPIFRVIDELYKRGAKVVYSSIAAIHVSGHANREEHKIVHELLQPKYFIPIHGEYRMLYNHGELAHDLGTPWENIFILNNGDIFEVNRQTARIGGYTTAEAILIDGESATLQDSIVLQQRKDLANDGVISVAIRLDSKYRLEGKPAILSYGALLDSDESQANSEIARFVSEYIRNNASEGSKLPTILRSRQFRNQLQNFFFNKTGRKPITLVSVLES